MRTVVDSVIGFAQNNILGAGMPKEPDVYD